MWKISPTWTWAIYLVCFQDGKLLIWRQRELVEKSQGQSGIGWRFDEWSALQGELGWGKVMWYSSWGRCAVNTFMKIILVTRGFIQWIYYGCKVERTFIDKGRSRNGGEWSGGLRGTTENQTMKIVIEGFELISLKEPRKRSWMWS